MRKAEVLAGVREAVERVLQAGGFTTLEVAMRTGISHRAAFGALLELERQGVVARSGNPGDWLWRLEGDSSFTDESRHFRTLFDHIPVVTYHYPVPYSSSEYYISPQVEALLGYPREAWSKASFWESLLHPDDGGVARYSEHSISTGTPFIAQYRVRSQDGRWIWIQDEATLATSPPDGKTYWLGVWVDVTSFRTTEEELTSSIRALNDLNDERLSLIGELVASQERDRRIPDEFGDDPVQVLATAGQALELLGSQNDDPDLQEVLERAAFAVRESTRRLRHVSAEDHPTE
jgi:PAS domain S-box-containing protein